VEFVLEEALPLLRRTPEVMRALLQNLPAVWIEAREGPGTFSPFDVVGHLIHGERTDWIPRAEIILKHGEEKTFEPFDRFAQEEASRGKSLDELLDTFAALRAANIERLQELRLDTETLQRRGRHPELGTVTLAQLLATWVTHDLNHLGQVARVLGRQYTDAVGPWRVYLPMLDRRR
jgi:uncharacterized damage-inducible protein DinB